MTRASRVLWNVLLVSLVLLGAYRVIGLVRAKLRPDPAARVVAAVFVPKAAEDGDAADLRELLEPIRSKHKIPAMAAAVIKDGKVIAIGATGVRAAGGTEAVTVEDKFHLGSDTKAMTATLVAVLVQEGKLSWATTVGEVFGDEVKDMDAGWRGVTIEQLLHNRGGAPADLNAGGLWGRLWERKGTPSQQRLELVHGVVSRPPAAEPGTKMIYSNGGFAIAGAMAEKVTGRAWEDLMQEKVFAPLGITTAGFGAPGDSAKVDQPWGHRPNGKPVTPGPGADNPPAIGPAGTAHMTIGDWAKFVAAHVRGDPAREARLVSPEMYAKLHTPVDGYAMGWGVAARAWAKGGREGDKGIVLTHAGSNTMWFCVAWLAPERDFAVLIATNMGGKAAEKAADEAAGTLIGAFGN